LRAETEELVQRSLKGDNDAFSQLVCKYQYAVYGLAFHYLKNFADAQDIAQEAFLEAYQKLGTLKHPERFASWLNGITKNLCRMSLRHKREEVSIDDISDKQDDERLPSPQETCEQIELHDQVMKAISQLPEPNRIALTLRCIDGLSYEEISDFLDVPLGTVKSRLYRAKRALKKELVSMVAQDLKGHELDPEFTQKIIGFLEREQDKLTQAWSEDMAVIDGSIPQDTHNRAISAFFKTMLRQLKNKDGAKDSYELVETLAQEYHMESLSSKGVGEMMMLLSGIMLVEGFSGYSNEMMEVYKALHHKFHKVAISNLGRRGGHWVGGAAGRFSFDDTPSSIGFAKTSGGTVGGYWSNKPEQGKKGRFPGYMICYFIRHPPDLIQKPINIGKNWNEYNQNGYTYQSTVESVGEGLNISAGIFPGCLKVKTVITGEGRKDGKKTPEIDTFVRGTRFMWFAPGVGLLKLEYHHQEGCVTEAELKGHSVKEGNNSYLPLAVGNIWRYHWTDTYCDHIKREIWRVASKDENRYRISCFNGLSHLKSE
jgi:RNA polymerase sigma-70 factor (ECF subfamily)